jgi:hypothetical protein
VAAGRRDRAGQAEVGDLDPAVVGEQDVLGLDVAVDDACLVRGAERREDRLEHVEGLPRREPTVLAHQVAQRAAGDVLHREEHRAPVAALVEDRDHVGVREPGRRLGLADEPGDELLVLGEPGMHHLERDRTVQPGVQAVVDGGHPAPRDALSDPVAPVERAPDERILQGRVHPKSLRWARAWSRQPAWREAVPGQAQRRSKPRLSDCTLAT